MATDFVIDTNVLVHASNCDYVNQVDCINIIDRLMKSNESICLDINGAMRLEYDRHLKPGMIGHTLLLLLSNPQNLRIRFIDRDIPAQINRKINQTGIKTADRIFVRIAYKSTDKVLVTQEYEDFVQKIRDYFLDEIDVAVIEAGEFMRDY